MIFDSLEKKCRYYQSLGDYKLLPNSFVLCHLDGRAFSKLIKNRFKKPFDGKFINMMNETAKYLCENIQGCIGAYVQSDEISLILSDFNIEGAGSGFFGYRMCKIQSIAASMATGKFNQLFLLEELQENELLSIPKKKSYSDIIRNHKLVEFDCKCWNVPTANDAMAWILYRQIDCIRNSKQQAAQSYLSHKELLGKHTDDQITLLKEKKGIDWNSDFSGGEKYGRFVAKFKRTYDSTEYGTYVRNEWDAVDAYPLTDENNRVIFYEMYPILKEKNNV